MSRVKRGTIAHKRRKNVLRQTKGYKGNLSTKERMAKVAIAHAGMHAFAHRRDKKNDFRRLWTVRINAIARENGISYSKLIAALKEKNVAIDRKILADLAANHKETFTRLVKTVT